MSLTPLYRPILWEIYNTRASYVSAYKKLISLKWTKIVYASHQDIAPNYATANFENLSCYTQV